MGACSTHPYYPLSTCMMCQVVKQVRGQAIYKPPLDYYHCTINACDILLFDFALKGQRTMRMYAVSLFKYSLDLEFRDDVKYYRAPDNKSQAKYGETIYPISCAFVFREVIDQDTKGTQQLPRMTTKGLHEHLYEGDLDFSRAEFRGIRVPKRYPGSYTRLLALLYVMNQLQVRVSFGDDGFEPVSNTLNRVLYPKSIKNNALEGIRNKVNLAGGAAAYFAHQQNGGARITELLKAIAGCVNVKDP